MKKYLLLAATIVASIFMGEKAFAASAVNDYINKNNIQPVKESVNIKIDMQDPLKNGGIDMKFSVGKPSMVIIHEVANETSTIDNEIAYMVRNQENAFVHSFVDGSSLKTIADTNKKAWGAGPFGNRYGVQIEQTREQSKGNFARQIASLANWTADQLIKYDLGAPQLVTETSKELDGNLASHKNISYKWGGTDHVDPDWYWANRGTRFFGQSYDMYQFKELVVKYYNAKKNKVIAPKILNTKVEGKPENGKFDVRVRTNKEVTSVKVPIWSVKNGQDDIVWYDAKKVADGEFLATFNHSKHRYEEGNYNIHAYAYLADKDIHTLVRNNLKVSRPPVPSVNYSTHVQNIGWQSYVKDGALSGTSGKSLRLEGIKMNLSNTDVQGGIAYSTHIQDIGWQKAKYNDQLSGTTGQSKRLEAIRIELLGDMAKNYDIYYRVHIQGQGWLGWAKNGKSAGSAGMSRRLEGINVKIVRKGEKFNVGSDAFVEKVVVPNVNYSTHVQNIGWQNYVSDGVLSGTSGKSLRLEGIKMNLSNLPMQGGIAYSTHIQNIGWQKAVYNNQLSGTTGQSKRLEGIRIELIGEIAKYYDVYYRVHIQDKGWLGWSKNGMDAGSQGMSKRLEAINIKLVKKGDKGESIGGGFLKVDKNTSKPAPSSSTPKPSSSAKPTPSSSAPKPSSSVKPTPSSSQPPKVELNLGALNIQQRAWFDAISPQAVRIANANNLFPSIMMSQAITESAWGQSELAKNANNLFGIKADASWKGAYYEKDTQEFVNGKSVTVKAKFRKYNSQAESLQDYVTKLHSNPSRYSGVLKSNAKTYENAARALQNGGYATDPNYANNLINRINNYKLNALD